MDYFQTNEASNYSDAAKKRNRIILIIAAVAIGLVGFYAVVEFISSLDLFYTRRTISYNEMVYQRPDTDKIFDKIDEIIEVVNSKATFYKKLKAVKSLEKDYENFYTMSALAYVKHKSDTTDDFFKEEVEFFGEVTPIFQQKLEEMFISCSEQSCRGLNWSISGRVLIHIKMEVFTVIILSNFCKRSLALLMST